MDSLEFELCNDKIVIRVILIILRNFIGDKTLWNK